MIADASGVSIISDPDEEEIHDGTDVYIIDEEIHDGTDVYIIDDDDLQRSSRRSPVA